MTRYQYIQTVLSAFMKVEPPIDLITGYFESSEEDWVFHDYVSYNLKPEFQWSTAIAIIEAAFEIVNETYANANIHE